jgi:hypothetical protein
LCLGDVLRTGKVAALSINICGPIGKSCLPSEGKRQAGQAVGPVAPYGPIAALSALLGVKIAVVDLRLLPPGYEH